MKRFDKQIFSLAVAAMLAAMTACGGAPGTSQTSSGAQPGTVAMGRYVEKDCAFPVAPRGLMGLNRAADGTVGVYAVLGQEEQWENFTSADNGDSWSAGTQELVAKSGLSQLDALCSKADGGLLAAGQYFSPEFEKELEKLEASGAAYSEGFEFPPLQLMDVSPDGTVRELPMDLSKVSAGHISHMAVAPGGQVVVQSYNEIYHFDATTGALLDTITLDSYASSIALCDGKLAVMMDGIATLYDLESGDPLETVDQLGFSQSSAQLNVTTGDNISGVAATGADGAFYFCTSAGIYRRTADGGVVERIVDGTLVSLGSPSVELTDMAVVEDGFLVAMRDTADGRAMLKKYVFDSSVPTMPDKALRIYSLAENKTIRQTINSYQLANPDTHVVFEVAPSELSASDAVRALNTQLLAGQGPDILVLDGMPVESYLEKRVLLPLDSATAEGTLKNITEAGKSPDGSLYSIPVRFAMPAVTVDSSVPENLDNVTVFADMVAGLAEKQKNNAIKMILQNCGGAVLINTLYPIFEPTLQTEGKPDEAKLRGFLEQLKRIADLQNKEEPFVTDTSPYATLDMQWTPINWSQNTEVMGIGSIASFRDFSNASSSVAKMQGSRLEPLAPAGTHPFVPLISLGICAGSQNVEAAQAFIKTALSQPIQQCDFKDGLPVNSTTLDEMFTHKGDDQPQLGAYGMTNKDGETTVVGIDYPTAQAMAELRGMIDALDTPMRNDRVLMDLLRTETAGYFGGTVGIDTTMTGLWQNLKLLQAE